MKHATGLVWPAVLDVAYRREQRELAVIVDPLASLVGATEAIEFPVLWMEPPASH